MLKAAGDEGTRWITELCNAVVRDGKIPKVVVGCWGFTTVVPVTVGVGHSRRYCNTGYDQRIGVGVGW